MCNFDNIFQYLCLDIFWIEWPHIFLILKWHVSSLNSNEYFSKKVFDTWVILFDSSVPLFRFIALLLFCYWQFHSVIALFLFYVSLISFNFLFFKKKFSIDCRKKKTFLSRIMLSKGNCNFPITCAMESFVSEKLLYVFCMMKIF